ncbi:hypothetical protein BC830DRAFT_341288 [Chytriomyces sp. MP71]|nr:hypothetical protein BC830DRAFT_341288 [Chytriomyces sp. MP71]
MAWDLVACPSLPRRWNGADKDRTPLMWSEEPCSGSVRPPLGLRHPSIDCWLLSRGPPPPEPSSPRRAPPVRRALSASAAEGRYPEPPPSIDTRCQRSREGHRPISGVALIWKARAGKNVEILKREESCSLFFSPQTQCYEDTLTMASPDLSDLFDFDAELNWDHELAQPSPVNSPFSAPTSLFPSPPLPQQAPINTMLAQPHGLSLDTIVALAILIEALAHAPALAALYAQVAQLTQLSTQLQMQQCVDPFRVHPSSQPQPFSNEHSHCPDSLDTHSPAVFSPPPSSVSDAASPPSCKEPSPAPIPSPPSEPQSLSIQAPSAPPKKVKVPKQPKDHSCFNCATRETPMWRRDELGRRVCNACGVYFRMNGRHRVVKLGDVTQIRRRNRNKTDGLVIAKTKRRRAVSVDSDEGEY